MSEKFSLCEHNFPVLSFFKMKNKHLFGPIPEQWSLNHNYPKLYRQRYCYFVQQSCTSQSNWQQMWVFSPPKLVKDTFLFLNMQHTSLSADT